MDDSARRALLLTPAEHIAEDVSKIEIDTSLAEALLELTKVESAKWISTLPGAGGAGVPARKRLPVRVVFAPLLVVVGVALGYAGFKGIRDYRGKPDIFGRKLKFTQTDIADGLATSAVLIMGEGKECQPLALITEAPITFANKVDRNELYIDPAEDMYGPFFAQKKR